MSIAEESTSMAEDAQTPRIVGEDGLTNKERRKAKQEAKRQQVEGAKVEKVERKQKRPVEDEGEEAAAGQPEQEGEEEVEVEALSHKEQRKRRKLEKKGLLPTSQAQGGEAAGAGSAGSSSFSGKPQQPALPERSPYAVWVGNLSFQTNVERLQGWFEERNVKGISRVHMPRGLKKFEQNKGFAYVDLPSKDAVDLAVGLSEDHLDGRRLLIKSSSDYRGRPAIDPTMAALAGAGSNAASVAATSSAVAQASQEASAPSHIGGGKTGLTKTAQKILRAQRNPAAPTLFVGNLSFNSDEEGLRELFEASAKARDAWKKAEKGEKKRAKKVERKKSSKKAKKAESSSDDDSDSDSDSSSSSSEGEEESSDEDSDEDESSEEEDEDEDEKDTVRGAGIRKIRMGTFEDSGKCKGFAFIDFHTPAHATASLVDLRNYRLDGRELKLEFAGADAVRRGAPKGAAVNAAGGRGNWPSPHESGARRGAPEWRTKKGEERKNLAPSEDSKHTRKREKRDFKLAARRQGPGEGGEEAAPATAPYYGADAEEGGEGRKRHKETQAERQARREKAAANGGGGAAAGGKRAKPGAALANAQRGKTGIDTSGEAGKKTTFE